MMQHTMIQSRDNAFVKELRRLSQESTAYRKQGQVWLEGDHLCRAALERGQRPAIAVFSESFWPLAQAEWAQAAMKTIVLADALFADVSALESPARMGFILDLPAPAALRADAATVVLDRVQDAGNVGSILRSAAAFGFGQIVALKGTAALWSQKVLRAGMGAHFGLHLVEAASIAEVQALQLPRQALMQAMDLTPVPLTDYEKTTVSDDFNGTTFSTSGVRWMSPDVIDMYVPADGVEVTSWFGAEPQQGQLYNWSKLELKDKYPFFMGGNQSLAVLKTQHTDAPKLLIVRDSYADSLVPFLTPHFSEIHLFDPRYNKTPLSSYLEENGMDQVLVLYSVANFVSDTNLFVLGR